MRRWSLLLLLGCSERTQDPRPEASVTPEVAVITAAPSPAASDTAYNPDLLKELAAGFF
jgi:hypothetical protein